VRRDLSTSVFRTLACLILGQIILIAGCGGSSSEGAAKTEEEARFKGLRSLGESNTKQAIADAKKKAAQELKAKAASKP
jgi:hypothetical protein